MKILESTFAVAVASESTAGALRFGGAIADANAGRRSGKGIPSGAVAVRSGADIAFGSGFRLRRKRLRADSALGVGSGVGPAASGSCAGFAFRSGSAADSFRPVASGSRGGFARSAAARR